MTIQDACAVFGVIVVVVQILASLFVSNRIAKSRDQILREMADTYLPREVAAERFRYYDYRLGDPAITPPSQRRVAPQDDG